MEGVGGFMGDLWGGWFAFHLPLIFPLVRAVTPSLSLRPEVSEVACVDAEAMFAALVGTEARTEALFSALTSKRAPLSLDTTTPRTRPPTPDSPFIHFAEKVSSSSPASQVGAPRHRRPVSPPGQSTPSHMPRRLARSSAPLYPLIATQERSEKKKRARHSAVSTPPFVCYVLTSDASNGPRSHTPLPRLRQATGAVP